MGASATAVALTGADQAIYAGPCVYGGFTVRETAGATAVVDVYDGTSATGTLLETITLASNESSSDELVHGVRANAGIYVDVVSGTIVGSIRVR